MLPPPTSSPRPVRPPRCRLPCASRTTTLGRLALGLVAVYVVVSLVPANAYVWMGASSSSASEQPVDTETPLPITETPPPITETPSPPPITETPPAPSPPPSYDETPPPPSKFHAYATRLEDETWTSRQRPSFLWAPMVVRSCSHLTPSWFAPCVAARSPLKEHMYAEELVYPDFMLSLPYFVDDDQKRLWLDGIKGLDRATYERNEWGEYMTYKSKHGQNYILHDVEIAFPAGSFDTWKPWTCTQPHARLGSLNITLTPTNTPSHASQHPLSLPSTNDSAIIVNSPDSWSFQHFLDRATHVLAQAAHLSLPASRPTVLTGKQPDGLVSTLWDTMGFTARRHMPEGPQRFQRLIWACKTVLIHPYLSWKTLEMMGMPWATGPFDTSAKNTVLYMSRSDGRAANGGRQVENEPAVLDAIRDLLAERGRGETLHIFNREEHATLDDLVNYLSTNVSAIVGPHGGALMNHRFAGPNVLMVEFMPASRLAWINYEEVSMLNQTYAVVIAPTVGEDGKHNMVVPPDQVVLLLSEHLGKESRPPGTSYDWDQE